MDLPESMRSKPRFRNMQRMDLDEAFKQEEHPLPHRHCVCHVVDRLRRTQPFYPLPRQAAQGPHADAGYRPREPGERGQEQRH